MVNPENYPAGFVRVFIGSPEGPEEARFGLLMYASIDNDNEISTISPCRNDFGEFILYNGVIYSTTQDDEIIAICDDIFKQQYNDHPWDVQSGETIVVTPPVNVPNWVRA